MTGAGLVHDTQIMQGLLHGLITPGTDVKVKLGVVDPGGLRADVLGCISVELVNNDLL